MHEDKEFVEIDVQLIKRETEKAFQVVLADGLIWWLPKSQVSDAENFSEGDKDTIMHISEWIHSEKLKQDKEPRPGLPRTPARPKRQPDSGAGHVYPSTDYDPELDIPF